MSGKTHFVLFNPASGGALAAGLTPETLSASMLEAGIDAEILIPGPDGDFAALVEQAAASSAETLVAAGGDGTVTAMAEAAIASGKQLAILPLGTANLLARDLAIPLDLPHWFATLPQMQPREIDVATVNGHVFLHKVVLGLMPGIVSVREHLRARTGRIPAFAFLGFLVRRIDRLRRMRVEIAIDGKGARRQSVAAVIVANNAYAEGVGRFFVRERLDGGKLVVYVAKRITLGVAVRVLGGMIVGNWRRADAFSTVHAETVTIATRKHLVKVMIDGEVATFEIPLRFATQSRALSVLAPAENSDGDDGSIEEAAAT